MIVPERAPGTVWTLALPILVAVVVAWPDSPHPAAHPAGCRAGRTASDTRSAQT